MVIIIHLVKKKEFYCRQVYNFMNYLNYYKIELAKIN
jgi:hypothetical protein